VRALAAAQVAVDVPAGLGHGAAAPDMKGAEGVAAVAAAQAAVVGEVGVVVVVEDEMVEGDAGGEELEGRGEGSRDAGDGAVTELVAEVVEAEGEPGEHGPGEEEHAPPWKLRQLTGGQPRPAATPCTDRHCARGGGRCATGGGELGDREGIGY
jgi:hypothetical protein